MRVSEIITLDPFEVSGLRTRLLAAVALLGAVFLMGTLGYYILGQVIPDSLFQTGRPEGHGWSLWDCAYMTIVTLTTVGYAEVLPHMDSVPGARQLTVAVLVLGIGVALYLVSSLITFFVEGEFAAIS